MHESILIPRQHPCRSSRSEHANRSEIHFITVCTKERQPVLACPSAHEILKAAWRKADSFLVGRYVIMPNHVHLFCSPLTNSSSLENWICYWKSIAARSWPNEIGRKLWRRDFWDTQLRRTQSYDRTWEYVRQNPVRHHKVTSTEAWPYQGEIHPLIWHD
jgi:REP element-mobilizing transposase RayT